MCSSHKRLATPGLADNQTGVCGLTGNGFRSSREDAKDVVGSRGNAHADHFTSSPRSIHHPAALRMRFLFAEMLGQFGVARFEQAS
jgi:hypothetical protein